MCALWPQTQPLRQEHPVMPHVVPERQLKCRFPGLWSAAARGLQGPQ